MIKKNIYYEVIEYKANILVGKNEPQFGFYENLSLATLSRFRKCVMIVKE